MKQSVAIPGPPVPSLTAVAACVRDTIASEMTEAGVVVAGLLGGMRERINGSITCLVRTRSATSFETAHGGVDVPPWGHTLKPLRSGVVPPEDGQGRGQVSFFNWTSTTTTQCATR